MLRTVLSLLVAISFAFPAISQKELMTDITFKSQKEIVIASAVVVDPCAPLVTVDSAAPPVVKKVPTFKTQKEQHKKKFAGRHHSKHKSHVSHHHKSHVHSPHPVPQKISTSHEPLHLTSPPGC